MFIASTALAVLVGAAFVILLITILQLRNQSRQAGRSEQVIATANHLQTLVLDLETNARRYAVTQRGVFLKPLRTASLQFPVVANRLVTYSKGDPVRFARAQRIKADVTRYLDTWAILVITAAADDPAKAKTIVLDSSGQRQVDALRATFTTFVDAEQQQVDDSRLRADRTESYAVVIGSVGLIGSLIIITIFGIYIARRVVRPIRVVAGAATRLAAGEYEHRVPAGGLDEIGELTNDFNTMAEAIERQQHVLAGQNGDLERLATMLRAVIDSRIDGIALTDLEGKVQIVNRPLIKFSEELGMSRRGTVIRQLLSIEDKMVDKERFRETMERLRLHPEDASADEFELFDPYQVLIGYTSPVQGENGKLIGRIWTLRDVTHYRELDRLKDEFVATVSHELRTPLTSMMGFLEMVRDGEAGELTEEQHRFLSIVHRSSQRLQRLVGDLLFVARLDASGLQLDLRDGVRLDEVVAEMVESSAAVALARNIDLRVENRGPVVIKADRERLGQLVANLISNGLKFTPSGGSVTARVSIEGDSAVLEIEDTGIGIPIAEQERLFTRFFRSSTATEQAIPGTGLGLGISKAIAEAHGGGITVRSQPGVGTCFHIELPISPDDEGRSA